MSATVYLDKLHRYFQDNGMDTHIGLVFKWRTSHQPKQVPNDSMMHKQERKTLRFGFITSYTQDFFLPTTSPPPPPPPPHLPPPTLTPPISTTHE